MEKPLQTLVFAGGEGYFSGFFRKLWKTLVGLQNTCEENR